MVFLPGFKSDMDGAKAIAVDRLARERGQACLRLDYAGHGRSGGAHEDGTISSWTQDTLAVIDQVTQGPLILVGSSMGGWIMTLVALARPGRIAGLVGIAAAPDFTDALVWDLFDAEQQAEIERQGYIDIPSEYSDEPLRITVALIEDGRRNFVLGGEIGLEMPVRLFHGLADTDVPWSHSKDLADRISGDEVRLTLIKSGGHRLSRNEDIALITAAVRELCDRAMINR
ncbi:MAG: alpha/beta hydrolase [Alphaproteobacteria bacterium]|nr:alpha/beta hydrolase [Alphaproteobacteria bacterium]